MSAVADHPGAAPAADRPGHLTALLRGRYRTAGEPREHLHSGAILYTTSDEDTFSELHGLELRETDDVLCVTGSGCRSLGLLIDGPAHITSIDANPVQNHLLELKMAGIRHLDHGAFLAFSGVRDDDGRAVTYGEIRGDLSPRARTFWDANVHVIEDGFLFSGAHETYYRTMLSPLIVGTRRKKLKKLFAFDSLEQQRTFYREEWDTRWWRGVMRAAMRPSVFKLGVRDPSYYGHIELHGESVADYCLRRVGHALTMGLARDNHFLSLLFLGRYLSEDAMPAYLLAEHYETVRAGLDRIEIVLAPIDAHLRAAPEDTYDKYSLSDISGWTPPEVFTSILRDAARAGRPGGRLVYRNFLTKRPVPAELQPPLVARRDIAEELDERDLAFAYTFEVADIGA